MNHIQIKDIEEFVSGFPYSNALAHKSFLITGATGLVGSTLVRCIVALDNRARITCPVRSVEKAKAVFEGVVDKVKLIECDLVGWIQSLNVDFDYIIHCASPTNGTYMRQCPVETVSFIYDTTKALLDYARRSPISSMVFVSSIEYYGQVFDEIEINESYQGYIDVDSPRSSYPLGKNISEFLCKAYYTEFGIPAKCARLTQTFGAGVSDSDNRVYAQFARSIVSSQDIVLQTEGTSAKQYCYITDTVSGILYILLKGKDGFSYNVANPDTYISIKDLAYLLKKEFNPAVKIRFELVDNNGYAPVTKLRLNTDLIYRLGWRPKYGLIEMFKRLIDDYQTRQSK